MGPSALLQAAVKLLRPDGVDSELSLSSFEREAMMVDGLRYPNLFRQLRWSPALPRPYIVLEHIGAPTLSDLLEDAGSISPFPRATSWLRSRRSWRSS